MEHKSYRQLLSQGWVRSLLVVEHFLGAAPEDVRPVVGRDLLGDEPVEDLRVAGGERVAQQAQVDGDESLAEEHVQVGSLVVLFAVEECAQRRHPRPLARLRHCNDVMLTQCFIDFARGAFDDIATDEGGGRRRRRVNRRLATT